MPHIKRIRRKLDRLFWSKYFFKPINSAESVFAAISAVTMVVLLYEFRSLDGVDLMSEFTVLGIGAVAYLGAWAIHCVFGLFASLYEAVKDEIDTGWWDGKTYTYKKPYLLGSYLISPDDNGQPKNLTKALKKEAPEAKFIYWKVDLGDRGRHRDGIIALVGHAGWYKNPDALSDKNSLARPLAGGFRLEGDTYLHTKLADNLLPVKMDVYLEKWTE